jgi:hypothetical protein
MTVSPASAYTPEVTQRSYRMEMSVEDMLALIAAEDMKDDGICGADFLNLKLEGGRETHHTGIEGVHSVEYNGHFGAAIYYTVDADLDIPAVHELVVTMLRSSLEEAYKVRENRANA